MHTHNECDKLTNIIHWYTHLQLDRPAVAHAALKLKVLNSSIRNNTQGAKDTDTTKWMLYVLPIMPLETVLQAHSLVSRVW